jgi:hypothetical protein
MEHRMARLRLTLHPGRRSFVRRPLVTGLCLFSLLPQYIVITK